MKTKQLVFENKIETAWQDFLGDKYIVITGVYMTRAKDRCIAKIQDPPTSDKNGILYVEYKNKETGVESVILQNEWFVEKNGKIEHLIPNIYENIDRYYDENLEMLPFDKDTYELINKN